jgi:hypothetical protein
MYVKMNVYGRETSYVSPWGVFLISKVGIVGFTVDRWVGCCFLQATFFRMSIKNQSRPLPKLVEELRTPAVRRTSRLNRPLMPYVLHGLSRVANTSMNEWKIGAFTFTY